MWIDIEDAAGNRLGPGPIITATSWSSVWRLNRIGEFACTMSARDPIAAEVLGHPKRVLRCYVQLTPGTAPVEIGAGVIDAETLNITADGALHVAGGDLLRELTYTSVDFLELSDGAGGPIATALAEIMATAPVAWSLGAITTTGRDDYGSFGGETTFGALAKLAEHGRQYFRYASGRVVEWLRSSFSASGFYAVQGGDPTALAARTDAALIRDLSVIKSSYEQVTRICPYGAGNGAVRLTLAHTSRSAPSGFTLDAANNILINDAAETALGVAIKRHLAWKEIGPISNSDTDLESAADVLFDATLRELQDRAAAQATYRLDLAALPAMLYPGQTLRVVHTGWVPVRDGLGRLTDYYQWVDLNTDLNILETRIMADANGVNATLTVSDGDRYPFSDAELQAAQLESGRLYEAHPQLSIAYAPVGPYTRRMDSTHNADFIVRIGVEVTALNYAILRWKSGPLISSVKSTAAAGGGGSTVTSASGGGATVTSASGGGATPTSSTFTNHGHSIGVTDSASGTAVTALGSGSSIGLAASGLAGSIPTSSAGEHDHTVVVPSHSHSVTVADHTHNVSVPDHTHTLTNTYGIYADTVNPTTISIYINGVDRTSALGGPWAAGGAAADDELDITTYLANASGGLRQNHTISFRCASGQGEVEVEVDMLVTLQAIAVV